MIDARKAYLYQAMDLAKQEIGEIWAWTIHHERFLTVAMQYASSIAPTREEAKEALLEWVPPSDGSASIGELAILELEIETAGSSALTIVHVGLRNGTWSTNSNRDVRKLIDYLKREREKES